MARQSRRFVLGSHLAGRDGQIPKELPRARGRLSLPDDAEQPNGRSGRKHHQTDTAQGCAEVLDAVAYCWRYLASTLNF